jgi:hypothetical protein
VANERRHRVRPIKIIYFKLRRLQDVGGPLRAGISAGVTSQANFGFGFGVAAIQRFEILALDGRDLGNDGRLSRGAVRLAFASFDFAG